MTQQAQAQQTITNDNKHILEKEFANLTEQEFTDFSHDDEIKSETTLGIVYQNIDKNSKQIFKEVYKEEYAKRKKIEAINDDLNEDLNYPDTGINIDTDTSLLEAIKQSNINNMSIFAKSKLLETIEEQIQIDRETIENYLDAKEIINENKAIESELFTILEEALRVVQPVNKPNISITMTDGQIWSEIRENEDWLLESKLKTYITAVSNEYQKKTTAHKSVARVEYKDDIHEINKLQKQIIEEIQDYNLKELNYISTAMDEGLEKYNALKETLDISVPQDNSLLSKSIRMYTLSEKPKTKELYEQATEYLKEQMKGSSKTLKQLSFFDFKSIIEFNGTDPKLKFLGDYKIIITEDKNAFKFNIVTRAFTQKTILPKKEVIRFIQENYITDLLKAKKTLERQFKGKKFQASPDTSDTNSVKYIDTNGFRIHLYQDTKDKNNKVIDYNIEYYPHEYQKSDLTESEKFHSTIEESLSEKRFAKHLENGEHIVLNSGEVLWYSSDKKFMIDMKPVPFKEVFDLYKSKNLQERNSQDQISFKGGSKEDKEEILNLIQEYDFYTDYINSYQQKQKKDQINKEIQKELKALGVTEISLGSKSMKI